MTNLDSILKSRDITLSTKDTADVSQAVNHFLQAGRRAPGEQTGRLLFFTLLTKVRLVKAMVFPLVLYGCES